MFMRADTDKNVEKKSNFPEHESSGKFSDITSEELQLQDYQLELENRIRNLLWTVSGDYTQQNETGCLFISQI